MGRASQQVNGTNDLVIVGKSKRQIKSEAKKNLGLIKKKLKFLQKAVSRDLSVRPVYMILFSISTHWVLHVYGG